MASNAAHLASLIDKLDDKRSYLPKDIAALAAALGEIEHERQINNERNPTWEITQRGRVAIIGALVLLFALNIVLGYAVYRGQMGQRVIAHYLVVTMERTEPLVGWGEADGSARKEPIESRIHHLIQAYVSDSDQWLASLPRQWLDENLDELNRILLLEKKQDTDGDGVVNTEDDCPNIPFGEASSEKFPGCPESVVTDTDHDGAYDLEDLCPDETGLSASWDGSEDWDIRSPGLWGASWRPAETMPEYLMSTGYPYDLLRSAYYGCADKDEDGIADTLDLCPDKSSLYHPDRDLDGCVDSETDVSDRWDFYKSPDDWATPIRSARGELLAFQWKDVTRADGIETNPFAMQCLMLDKKGKTFAADAKKFTFGSYSECRVVRP